MRRLGLYVLALWAAVTLNFIIPRLIPGSPADAVLAQLRINQPNLSAEQVKAVQTLFGGSDTPSIVQYFQYLGQVAHLDFGTSTGQYPLPVIDVVGPATGWTLLLVGSSVLISFVLGTLVGVVAGWRAGRSVDRVATVGSVVFASLPYFWVALLLFAVFGVQLAWFPTSGSYDSNTDAGFNVPYILSLLHYGVLPATTIVLATFGGWVLGMRNMMLTTVSEDYVLLARAKGLSPWRVMSRYAARNAILPNVTGLAMALGTIFAGSLLTEVVFSYPGLGYQLYQAIQKRDYPVMQAIFLMVSVGVLVGNFVIDSVYVLLDPRTRS